MSTETFDNITKENQVKFLEETISKLESFKQSIESNEVFIENASMQDSHTAANKEETGGHNIYLSIDYQENKQNIK